MTLASQIAADLPFLRRYARALTGAQTTGDGLVAATLEAIIAGNFKLPADAAPRLALYMAFHTVWDASVATDVARAGGEASDGAANIAGARLAAMTPLSRQALLLGAMEGFSIDDVGRLIDRPAAQVQGLFDEALAEISRQTMTRVMIIEDQPIIALDIETIVRDLGHDVTGIATTHDEAITLFHAAAPGLVLADVQLADASSGMDAVSEILAERPVPVIFITAFPELLLTGERPEPTFLIRKPFQTATVTAAISQALFFNAPVTVYG
jgi:CheY-like chemotaxis protein